MESEHSALARYWAVMSEENVEIVRRVFDAWAEGEFGAAILRHLDEHVLYVVPPDFPEFGVFVGLDGMAEFTRRFLAQWERLTIEARHAEAVGDTVLVNCVQRGKGRVSGIEGDNAYSMLFTFRGDKIIRIEAVMDEGSALRAAGLSE
jgi:ketosteroid isomerase-like protein